MFDIVGVLMHPWKIDLLLFCKFVYSRIIFVQLTLPLLKKEKKKENYVLKIYF